MHLIWAHGQDSGSYSHRPLSGLERGPDPSIPDFYREDELKYHGKENRGIDTVDFMGEEKRERMCKPRDNAAKAYSFRTTFLVSIFWRRQLRSNLPVPTLL